MPSKVFQAKQQGTCSICSWTIEVGDRITKDNKSGKYVHADCLWPDKARDNADSPSSQGRQAQRKGITTPAGGGGTTESVHGSPASSPAHANPATHHYQAGGRGPDDGLDTLEFLAAKVTARFERAHKIVKSQYPIVPDQVLIPAIVEVAHQLFAEETTQEIQAGADRRARGVR
jgi:hypothetical protein